MEPNNKSSSAHGLLLFAPVTKNGEKMPVSRLTIFALSLSIIASAEARANQIPCIQSVLEITSQLQSERENPVSTCEVRQVLAAEQRHVEMTGGSCDANSKTKLVKIIDQALQVGQNGPSSIVSKVSVVTEGIGQPADTFIVTGAITKAVSTIDCKITSVKLAPMDDGLPSPVAKPDPYKQHPRE